jgi:hypothetical protein
MAVSFLDELKEQAKQVPSAPPQDTEAIARNLRLANGACRLAHEYWDELKDQLNVIEPPCGSRYLIDGRNPLAELKLSDFRVTPKVRTAHNGDMFYEGVILSWKAASGQRMRIERELPHEVDRIRANLRQAGIYWHEVGLRSSNGRPMGTALEFQADVAGHVRIAPIPETGRVALVFVNIDQIERVEAEFPAAGLRSRLLDEIGRWIVGRPNVALEYAASVKRYQH